MGTPTMARGLLLLGLGGFVIAGCGGCLPHKAETPGQRFERAMKQLAENCTRHPPRPTDSACDALKLKSADPLATEESRLAHAIKIPDPLPADSGYRPGMTPEEYFDLLCRTEAGEFIYKTVENVDGIFMMRPREEATDYELEHLYALEDPYGYVLGESSRPQDSYIQPMTGKYEYLEVPLSRQESRVGSDQKYVRYFREYTAQSGRDYQTALKGQFVRVPYIVSEAVVPGLRSRYGFTWRGITRPHDRKLGIAGGELIILDLTTQEIIAVRRGYIRSGWMRNLTGIWWLTGLTCPGVGAKRGHLFIKEVLKPVAIPDASKGK